MKLTEANPNIIVLKSIDGKATVECGNEKFAAALVASGRYVRSATPAGRLAISADNGGEEA